MFIKRYTYSHVTFTERLLITLQELYTAFVDGVRTFPISFHTSLHVQRNYFVFTAHLYMCKDQIKALHSILCYSGHEENVGPARSASWEFRTRVLYLCEQKSEGSCRGSFYQVRSDSTRRTSAWNKDQDRTCVSAPGYRTCRSSRRTYWKTNHTINNNNNNNNNESYGTDLWMLM